MRPPGEPATTAGVLVVRTLGAPPPPRRWLRRPRPRPADPESGPLLPVTELTVVSGTPLEEEADDWLARVRNDDALRDELLAGALLVLARALSTRRVVASDPGVPEPSLESALVVRIGYGSGDDVADGRWEEALEVPAESARSGRLAGLRPQERLAAILGGREDVLVCEELVVRARADVDAKRTREAALQLRPALDALLADHEALAGQGGPHAARQEKDLAFLEERREITAAAAEEALRGEVSEVRAAELAETLTVCERALRRRALHG